MSGIRGFWIHCRQCKCSCNSTKQLGKQVYNALGCAQVASKHERKGHCTIDLGTAVVPNGICKSGDCKSKGQCYLQHPASVGCILCNAHGTSTTNNDKESHCHVLC